MGQDLLFILTSWILHSCELIVEFIFKTLVLPGSCNPLHLQRTLAIVFGTYLLLFDACWPEKRIFTL